MCHSVQGACTPLQFRDGRSKVGPHLELEGLTKRYPGVVSVDGIHLSVEHGEFICLLGPSGCGKTTTLRMLAGFLTPDAGRILLLDEPLSNIDANLRGDMRLEIRRLHEQFRNTSIYVTHDRLAPDHLLLRRGLDFGAFMRAEHDRWVKVVKEAGIKPQ